MRRFLLAAILVAAHGCAIPDSENVGAESSELASPGPWKIPADTLAVGDANYVLYTGAGLWNDGKDCSGGLTPGAAIVRSYLLAHFPQTSVIGGYNCRQNTANTAYMSIHAVGRALDIMLPLSNSSADNDLGDPIGNWLIENAEAIGIQYIIWDEWTWMASRTPGQKGKLYTGPNPHHDHLHVELSEEAGMQTTDWFSGIVTPPTKEGCAALGPQGGVIDELDPCFEAFGSSTYWRTETGVGNGGSLLWTNAWSSTTPGNWGRWNLDLAEAGDYEVEVYLTDPFAVYAATRYVVRHGGVDSTVIVDQAAESAGTGGAWVSLGAFPFAAGADQSVAVFDNYAGTVASQQHIVVDAMRITRLGVTPPPPPMGEAPPVAGEPDPDVALENETIAPPPARSHSGCAIGGASTGLEPGLALVVVALVAVRWRSRGRRRA